MTPYRDRLEAGEYDAKKQAKKSSAISKTSSKKTSAKK